MEKLRELLTPAFFRYVLLFICVLLASFGALLAAGLFSDGEPAPVTTCVTSWGGTC